MLPRVTIRDVAERAACGVSTVSRVLNASGPASPDVRERVLTAARELGFEFSEIGRSLQSRRSNTLAVLVPSLRNDVFAMAIEGGQKAAAAAGYQMLLSCVNYDEDSEIEAIRTLIAKGIDGAVLTVANPDDSAALDCLERHGVPYCLLFNQPTNPVASLGVDNVAAARMVAERLHAAGHREVGFVALGFRASERSRLRYEGFCEGLKKNGHADAHLLEATNDPQRFQSQIAAFASDHPQMTAIFASNDLLALSCIRALARSGLRVPEDISVVGFDGIDTGELVTPSLATIVTPNAEMGRMAVIRVIDMIRSGNRTSSGRDFLPFHFRSGDSLGARRMQDTDGRAATRPSACPSP